MKHILSLNIEYHTIGVMHQYNVCAPSFLVKIVTLDPYFVQLGCFNPKYFPHLSSSPIRVKPFGQLFFLLHRSFLLITSRLNLWHDRGFPDLVIGIVTVDPIFAWSLFSSSLISFIPRSSRIFLFPLK